MKIHLLYFLHNFYQTHCSCYYFFFGGFIKFFPGGATSRPSVYSGRACALVVIAPILRRCWKSGLSSLEARNDWQTKQSPHALVKVAHHTRFRGEKGARAPRERAWNQEGKVQHAASLQVNIWPVSLARKSRLRNITYSSKTYMRHWFREYENKLDTILVNKTKRDVMSMWRFHFFFKRHNWDIMMCSWFYDILLGVGKKRGIGLIQEINWQIIQEWKYQLKK